MKIGATIVVAVLVVLAASTQYMVKRAREKVLCRNCEHQLRSLGAFFLAYPTENNGQLPSDLESLDKVDKELIIRILVCPGTGHAPGGFTNMNSWVDYTFVDWSAILGTNAVPNDYPIVYDRRMSNHNGRGINILMVDGTVEWDSNAKWLKKF